VIPIPTRSILMMAVALGACLGAPASATDSPANCPGPKCTAEYVVFPDTGWTVTPTYVLSGYSGPVNCEPCSGCSSKIFFSYSGPAGSQWEVRWGACPDCGVRGVNQGSGSFYTNRRCILSTKTTTLQEDARLVVTERGPLHYHGLADTIMGAGFVQTNGATPAAPLNTIIAGDIKRPRFGTDSTIERFRTRAS
jgi:hypothetical protein